MKYRGKYTHVNGDVYEPGDYKDNKSLRNGRGKMTFAHGAVYEEDYKDDKNDGRGNFTHVDGNVHEGNFKDDKNDTLGWEGQEDVCGRRRLRKGFQGQTV